jgi:hypothetical protein
MDATEPGGHGVAVEPDRVPTKTVVGAAVLLTVLAVVSMVLVALLFKGLLRGADRRDEVAVEAAGLGSPQDRLPPPPRLQVYGTRHWEQIRSAEQARLSSYGWMDRSTGAVHIPVERAMELIAQRGVGPLPPAPAVIPAAEVTPAPGARK